MGGNTFGKIFRVTTWGESHGAAIGVVVDGVPAGMPLSEADIQRELDRRRPGQSVLATPRKERDEVEILSGVFNGRTTGAPIAMVVWNRDVRSEGYRRYFSVPRPGHADFTARVKYGGYNDWRGGGRFSGRVTASLVMAGAVALKLLQVALGVEVMAYTVQVGRVRCPPQPPEALRGRYSNPVRCPDPRVARAMEEEMLRTAPTIRKRIGYLATLGNVATLLGLLGTIFGLIQAFEGVSMADPATKQEILARGISVAMLTTAFGLIVAIPCLLSHAFLQSKAIQMIEGLEEKAFTLFNKISALHRDIEKKEVRLRMKTIEGGRRA